MITVSDLHIIEHHFITLAINFRIGQRTQRKVKGLNDVYVIICLFEIYVKLEKLYIMAVGTIIVLEIECVSKLVLIL